MRKAAARSASASHTQVCPKSQKSLSITNQIPKAGDPGGRGYERNVDQSEGDTEGCAESTGEPLLRCPDRVLAHRVSFLATRGLRAAFLITTYP